MSHLWTVENHPHPKWTLQGWFLCAPREHPRAERPNLTGYLLPDGRQAYAFPTQERAQRSADRANAAEADQAPTLKGDSWIDRYGGNISPEEETAVADWPNDPPEAELQVTEDHPVEEDIAALTHEDYTIDGEPA